MRLLWKKKHIWNSKLYNQKEHIYIYQQPFNKTYQQFKKSSLHSSSLSLIHLNQHCPFVYPFFYFLTLNTIQQDNTIWSFMNILKYVFDKTCLVTPLHVDVSSVSQWKFSIIRNDISVSGSKVFILNKVICSSPSLYWKSFFINNGFVEHNLSDKT